MNDLGGAACEHGMLSRPFERDFSFARFDAQQPMLSHMVTLYELKAVSSIERPLFSLWRRRFSWLGSGDLSLVRRPTVWLSAGTTNFGGFRDLGPKE